MKLNGASLIIKLLNLHGIDTIFGYPGGAVLPLYDELFKQNELHHILVRHEQAAVHAAEAYARSTGKIGAVLVTSGPGATNTITGLTDAMLDSVPVLCLTGQVATHLIGSDAFQEADTSGITRACTKHNYLVDDVNDLEHVVTEAIHVATTGRPGPVVVDLPKNVQLSEVSFDGKLKPSERPSYNPPFEPDTTSIEQALELIANAKQPVFYVGGGVINAGDEACEELRTFVRKTGFPITQTLMGLGAFPCSDPQFIKMLGMHGSLEANMAMAECDVMINIGARFDDRVTGRLDAFSPNSKKIHVDVDASSINKNVVVDCPVIGDAGAVLKQFNALWDKKNIKSQNIEAWWKKIEGWREAKSFHYEQGKEIIKPQYALDRLNEQIKDKDFYLSTDVGQHQMWAAQFIEYNRPKTWLTSGGLGTMGYGLPAAMGAQVANPDDLTICISGEASIMMNIQELSSIKQYRLPVKLMILNNQYMGMVRQWQELFHGNRHSESYMDALPDFVELAEAFGIKGMRCTDPAKVDDTIAEMIAHDGPVLLDMVVDRNENVYPMIPAGAAHNEVQLNPEQKIKVDKKQAAVAV